jgi:hypothetical protein
VLPVAGANANASRKPLLVIRLGLEWQVLHSGSPMVGGLFLVFLKLLLDFVNRAIEGGE